MRGRRGRLLRLSLQRRKAQALSTKPQDTLALLRAYESRNVTFIEPDGSWPIVWDRAQGVQVWDAAGKKYLDLTGAFGVAAAGHANPRVVRAGRWQMGRLLHAMGDVHPHALKARLARELSRLTFERWSGSHGAEAARSSRSPSAPVSTGKTIFCNSGFETVEAALKTAKLATGKPDVVVFEGAYHGLGYGALNATHREHFRSPFREQLREFGHFLPFPKAGVTLPHSDRSKMEPARDLAKLETSLRRLCRQKAIGAVLVEPIQVRGGVNIPPPEFLPLLRRVCDERHALLILDEIYTGFGRTGEWFACEHARVVPDLICLGKALTGGFPLSACVGRTEVMDAAWPPSSGEAIHTSTFLGHPVGCAMALAQIKEIEARGLVKRSAELGGFLLAKLAALQAAPGLALEARGQGLLAGVEFREPNGQPATRFVLTLLKDLLRRGFVFLPEGRDANVLSFTPPLTITKQQLGRAAEAIRKLILVGEDVRSL